MVDLSHDVPKIQGQDQTEGYRDGEPDAQDERGRYPDGDTG